MWWATRELKRSKVWRIYSTPVAFSRRSYCAEPETEEDCGVLSKRALLQQEGFTEEQITAVLKRDPRSDKLAWLLTILKERGITGPTAGSFVSSQSNFLLHGDLNSFRLNLEALHDAGMEPEILKKALNWRIGLITCSVSNLQNYLTFLKDAGLSPSSCFTVMSRAPIFLKIGIQTCLKPRCDYLRERGVSKEGICMLLRNQSRVFKGSQPSFMKRIEVLEKVGLDIRTKAGVRALGLWAGYPHENLVQKLEFIESLGVAHEDTVALVKMQPSIMCLTCEHLKKKIDFVLNTPNVSVSDMLKSPPFFTSSLEKRILPRFAILNELSKKGLLKKHLSLGSVVSISDKVFERRYTALLRGTTCDNGSASKVCGKGQLGCVVVRACAAKQSKETNTEGLGPTVAKMRCMESNSISQKLHAWALAF